MTKASSVNCAADPSLWTVEWSPDQGCLHIIQIGELLETNLAIALRRQANPGYLLIAIFATEDEAEHFAEVLEPRLRGN